MSAHCYHPWKFGDEITDDFIGAVAACCKSNRGWCGPGWSPGVFAILSIGDQFVWITGAFLDNWNGESLEESVEEFTAGSSDDESVLNQARQVLIRVVQQLESEGLLEYKKEKDDGEDGRTDV
jgi:hypothetical protein